MTSPESRTEAEHGIPAESRPVELLESVQQLTGVGVWLYDDDSDETWWSDQARDILGVTADIQPTFESVAEKFVEDDRRRSRELFERARERGEAFAVEVGFMNGGTTERYLRIRGAPRSDDSEGDTLYGTVRNITDAKRQEQRIEVLRKTSQELREANSRQAVAEIMADTAKNILGLDNTTIRLVDETEGTLQVVVVTEECVTKAGTRPDYPADKDTPAARTFRTGEPELHTDHSSTEDDQERGELRSGLYVPIGDHGVLSAGDITVDAFDERDVEAASLLGQLGAKAITRIGWTRRSRAI
ncbi:GAF domain-containing protein [Halorubrum salsamenti]|uniref:GAF domain-containing protein n=1 Tax=Halorubrum salsamenti TaxID=2583990 RepID=UPI00119D5FB6|nr:GAF domain-containing protein [Halorubrum salsamenti]